ncbi:hypothetical protein [Azospirillum doebereinerae]
MAGLCLIDPFDTGRFGSPAGAGMPHAGPRLVNASRGRDARFDSAVIGNSHAQLIDPERLSASTGGRFVSLTTPGTGPVEQLAMARWFVAHHRDRIGALVIGLDQLWCRPDGDLAPPNPFPFWLYAPDRWTYVAGLLKPDNLKYAWRRLGMLAGSIPAARVDGYDDYDQGRVWRAEEVEARLAEAGPWNVERLAGEPLFPGVGLLGAFLSDLPRGTAVSLVFTPMHARALPAPGSPGESLMARCKTAYRALAKDSGAVAVVDLLKRSALADEKENFWDLTHYRGPVARVVEETIVASLIGARMATSLP